MTSYPQLHMIIDGEKIPVGHRRTHKVVNPATEEVLGELPLADWIGALPADCVIGLEVPQLALVRGEATPANHVRRCVAAARGLGA